MLGELLAVQIYLGKMRRAVKLQKEALAAILERHGEASPVTADADKRKASLAVGKAGAPLAGEFPIAAKADHGVPPERNYSFHFT